MYNIVRSKVERPNNQKCVVISSKIPDALLNNTLSHYISKVGVKCEDILVLKQTDKLNFIGIGSWWFSSLKPWFCCHFLKLSLNSVILSLPKCRVKHKGLHFDSTINQLNPHDFSRFYGRKKNVHRIATYRQIIPMNEEPWEQISFQTIILENNNNKKAVEQRIR